MREILFKAKRLDNGGWAEGYYVCHGGCSHTIVPAPFGGYIVQDGTFYAPTAYMVDPATVCQYTGLTDKNGVKIFEGDIIRWKHWNEKHCERPVQYDYEWNRFCVWMNGAESLGVNKHLSEEIEVIGTIHGEEPPHEQ